VGREVPIHSLRAGDAFGTHTVVLAGPGERIELTHVATRREVFAIGANPRREWIVGASSGARRAMKILPGSCVCSSACSPWQLCCVAIASLFLRRVTTDEMAPTLLPGDLVGSFRHADARRHRAHARPERSRALRAAPDRRRARAEGAVRRRRAPRERQRVRQQEPNAGRRRRHDEGDHLVQAAARAPAPGTDAGRSRVPWKTEPTSAASQWYVLADNREWALDSRCGRGDSAGGDRRGRLRIRTPDELGTKKDAAASRARHVD
jgi:hypothetical protein